MNHTIIDYSLILAVLTWVGGTGITVFRDHRDRKNGNGKPTMTEIREALRVANAVVARDTKEALEASMRPVVDTLGRIEDVNGTMRDALIRLDERFGRT